jgi:hypothetical protein
MRAMKNRLISAGACALGLGALTSCGGAVSKDDALASLDSQAGAVTTLEFTRSVYTGKATPPLNVAVTDPVQVRDLYRTTLALPELTPSDGLCDGADVVYHLTFKVGASVVMEADERPDGCQAVTIAGVPSLVAGPAYWARLSAGLGVPESIMYPGGT